MIKNIKQILKLSVFVSLIFSFIYFCFSLGHFYCNQIYHLQEFYNQISAYSSIFKFTFVILATYLAIEQLSISHASYNKTVQQLHFTQNDISNSRLNSIKKETIDHVFIT
jgi:hypothetical protein